MPARTFDELLIARPGVRKEAALQAILSQLPPDAERRERIIAAINIALGTAASYRERILNAPSPFARQALIDTATDAAKNQICGAGKIDAAAFADLCAFMSREDVKADDLDSWGGYLDLGIGTGIGAFVAGSTAAGWLMVGLGLLAGNLAGRKADEIRNAPRDPLLLKVVVEKLLRIRDAVSAMPGNDTLNATLGNAEVSEAIKVPLAPTNDDIAENLPAAAIRILEDASESPDDPVALLKAMETSIHEAAQAKHASIEARLLALENLQAGSGLAARLALEFLGEAGHTVATSIQAFASIASAIGRYHLPRELGGIGGFALTANLAMAGLDLLAAMRGPQADPALLALSQIQSQLVAIQRMLAEGFSAVMAQNRMIMDGVIQTLDEVLRQGTLSEARFHTMYGTLANIANDLHVNARDAVHSKMSNALLKAQLLAEHIEDYRSANLRTEHDDLLTAFVAHADAATTLAFVGTDGTVLSPRELAGRLATRVRVDLLSGLLPFAASYARGGEGTGPEHPASNRSIANPVELATAAAAIVSLRISCAELHGGSYNNVLRAIYRAGKRNRSDILTLTSNTSLELTIRRYAEVAALATRRIGAVAKSKVNDLWHSALPLPEYLANLYVGPLAFARPIQWTASSEGYKKVPKEASHYYYVAKYHGFRSAFDWCYASDSVDPLEWALRLGICEYNRIDSLGDAKGFVAVRKGQMASIIAAMPVGSYSFGRVLSLIFLPNDPLRGIPEEKWRMIEELALPRYVNRTPSEGPPEPLRHAWDGKPSTSQPYFDLIQRAILSYRAHVANCVAEELDSQSKAAFAGNPAIEEFEVHAASLGLLLGYRNWRDGAPLAAVSSTLPLFSVAQLCALIDRNSLDRLRQGLDITLADEGGVGGRPSLEPLPLWDDLFREVTTAVGEQEKALLSVVVTPDVMRGPEVLDDALRRIEAYAELFGIELHD